MEGLQIYLPVISNISHQSQIKDIKNRENKKIDGDIEILDLICLNPCPNSLSFLIIYFISVGRDWEVLWLMLAIFLAYYWASGPIMN